MMAIVLTMFLALLQVADWHTTRTILANGGRELNPLIRWAMAQVGIDAALIVKGIAVVALGYWVGMQSEDILAALVVVYVAVICHNLKSMPGNAK